MDTLFSAANHLYRNGRYYESASIYEYLSDCNPSFKFYSNNEMMAKKMLSKIHGEKEGKRKIHYKSASNEQKRLRIAHYLSCLKNPDIIDLCNKDGFQFSDLQYILAKANASNSSSDWLYYVNKYFLSSGIAEIKIKHNNEKLNYFNITQKKTKTVDGPLVTIFMPCYNSEKFIEHSVSSVLNQSYQNFELCIYDDMSSDNTREILSQLERCDNRIKVKINKSNLGTYKTRNEAFLNAKGKYFTVLDSDDYALTDRISNQVKILEKNEDCIGVMTNWIRMHLDGSFYFKPGWGGGYCHEAHATLMIRAEKVKKAVGYWDSVRFGADTEYIERLKKVFGNKCVRLLKTMTVIASYHENSLTCDPLTGINVSGYKGLSPIRKLYRDNWRIWHDNNDDLYMPHPMKDRRFPVPNEIL
jgi:glycosyltransferase involved in cell wall biosynthesis